MYMIARASTSPTGGRILTESTKKGSLKGNLASWAIRLADKSPTLPLLVFALAALVYGMYGFEGVLLRDYSIFLYSGQRVAEGVPPYVGIFDHKGPFSPLLAGLGVVLSEPLNLEDVYGVRGVFFLTGCLTVVAIYLLGTSVFSSRAVGFLAALTFLGFYAYAHPVASGPEPKTPMVLFEVLSLLFASNKRWFWGAFFGALAFLVWQPMGVFAVVVFLLALTRPTKEERIRGVLLALGGVGVPLVVVFGYFYYHGALRELVEGQLFSTLCTSPGGNTRLPRSFIERCFVRRSLRTRYA
jgi:hypothetical protein